MFAWKLFPDGKLTGIKCRKPEDARAMLGSKRNEKWLFDHPVLHTNDCVVYMMHEPDGKYGDPINVLAVRLLIDLDIYEAPCANYVGEGLHTHCPRGPVVFFKMTSHTASSAGELPALLDYTWDAFCGDWPDFFRIGRYLPYKMLEPMYHTTKHRPMDDYLHVCSWGTKTIDRVVQYVLKRPYQLSGDRARCMGWLVAVCVRRLYGEDVWDQIDLAVLLKRDHNSSSSSSA